MAQHPLDMRANNIRLAQRALHTNRSVTLRVSVGAEPRIVNRFCAHTGVSQKSATDVTSVIYCGASARIRRHGPKGRKAEGGNDNSVTDTTASLAKQQIVVRSAHGADEMRVCVELQQRVWGYSAIDTVPDQIFIVANKTGGHVLVAYERDEPIGFALAFAAIRDGVAYLHSHMVAVVEGFQNRGVGRLLKLAQREDAMARGIDLIEWTFDPLQLKNAHFNIARLGAIARRYVSNLYGRTSSPLHAGLPTDRLVAEWWVRSERVERIINGGLPVIANAAERVVIPAAIRELCRDNPSAAELIQSGARDQFARCFSRGLAAVAFEWKQEQGNYVLEPYED